ncbi:hypothetical protein [Tepidimonas sp.]|uniref:hypothetical protein n=1 Tax=Tepidimonas sp. TaxID=2002775 RepID=UPI00391CFB29
MTTELKQPTRAQYMAGQVTFADFYRAVNETAGVRFAGRGGITLDEVKKALASGDEHLNSIPLVRWDALASGAEYALRSALKAHGDFYSQAGGVCCMKQAARDAVEQVGS